MIEIKNLAVRYGKTSVYENFSLRAEDNKITCILGESGCGKTTLLNAVAGLVPYGGEISPVAVSYVFQSPRLLPDITVMKNLTVTGAGVEEARAMLARVGLSERCNAYPAELSGGEAQRVALCRAFLFRSGVLLMDEPFSSLDLKTKLSVMELFKGLQAEEGRSTLFVTHDIDEALFLADRILVVKDGNIVLDEKCESQPFGAASPLRDKIIGALLA